MYNSLKGFIKKSGAKRLGYKKVGRNDWGPGAKRLGCRGETSRHQIWGETTRGETTRGELVLGRNDLLPVCVCGGGVVNLPYLLVQTCETFYTRPIHLIISLPKNKDRFIYFRI